MLHDLLTVIEAFALISAVHFLRDNDKMFEMVECELDNYLPEQQYRLVVLYWQIRLAAILVGAISGGLLLATH